jgi:hypothetical protein
MTDCYIGELKTFPHLQFARYFLVSDQEHVLDTAPTNQIACCWSTHRRRFDLAFSGREMGGSVIRRAQRLPLVLPDQLSVCF